MNIHKFKYIKTNCDCEDKQPIIGLKTQKELEQALKNIGFDITCGACAMIFYTGMTNVSHDINCFTDDRIADIKHAIKYFNERENQHKEDIYDTRDSALRALDRIEEILK